MNVLLKSLLHYFAPILTFTTEEIFQMIDEKKGSIHLQSFVDIPEKWKNSELNEKWNKIRKIKEISNISIEEKRISKEIGSSLEANINIHLNKELFELAKDYDFSEICITSGATLFLESDLDKKDGIKVETKKIEGTKCPVCWKISKSKCERHG